MQRRVAPGHPWYEIGNQENERYDFRAIAKNLEQNPPFRCHALDLQIFKIAATLPAG